MKALFELARDLCLLRRGPQDLPYSPGLAATLFAFACLADLVLAVVVPDNDPAMLPRILVGNLLMVGLPWVALNIAGLHARFAQVAGAMSLVSITFAFLVFPVLLLNFLDASDKESASRTLAVIAYLALLGWYVVVEGSILRHALKLPLALGIAIALIFELTNIQVRQAWFGSPQPVDTADAKPAPKKDP